MAHGLLPAVHKKRPCLTPDRAASVMTRETVLAFDVADDLIEDGRLSHRQVGEHLPIQSDVLLLKKVHELAVGQAMLPCRGVDARDPERPHIALAIAAVAIGIGQGVGDRLVRRAERAMAHPAMSGGQLEDLLVTAAGLRPALHARHAVLLPSPGSIPRTATSSYALVARERGHGPAAPLRARRETCRAACAECASTWRSASCSGNRGRS